MSTTVVGRNDLGLTIETINNNGVVDPNTGVIAVAVGISTIVDLPGVNNVQEALASLATGGGSGGVSPVDLASTAAGKGASMVGIQDAAARYTGVTVEAALVEVPTKVELASTAHLKGAALVSIEDAGARYTATTVEGALVEVATEAVLASTATGKGASTVGIEDSGTFITATTVEGALAELAAIINALDTTYLPIASPTFTGQLLSTDRGTAAAVAIGGSFTGGDYGFFFPTDNYVGISRAGVEVLKIDSGNIKVFDNGADLSYQLGEDTAFQRSNATDAAVIANPVGCMVNAGLSAWGHAIPGSQPVAGPATAGAVYTAAEQTMLQIVYDALRDAGIIS